VASQKRPLSPHIQIYKPQITSVLSITHRLTGVALLFAALLLSSWVISATYGNEAFNQIQNILSSWLGVLILIGLTVSIFYHLGNGIRHLFWDFGKGFELKDVKRSGLVVILFTLIMSIITWFIIFNTLTKS
jgi:succinate dehydrogenase / fumarate reductase cytochrome b subunit